MEKKYMMSNYFLIILFTIAFVFPGSFSNAGDLKNAGEKKKSLSKTTADDAFRFNVNRLDIPINNRGVIANVDLVDIEEGQIDGKGFLFSGGFLMGGKNGNLVWANGVASASRVEDYLPGTATIPDTDPRMKLYILKESDPPFGESWQDWKNAVDLGAYFYDGDKDGAYNPVDKNGNGSWDADEDRPDLLGDLTAWCVYTDALPKGDRRYSDVNPLGIEIRQTIWGYSTSGDLGNIIFIRYSINNAGTVAQRLDSVYFGVWADPDLGSASGYTDDLVGSEPNENTGYVYNDGPDATFGVDPPTFLIDFFQGPLLYTNNPADLAFNTKGPILGIDTIQGARNLGMSSFVHYMNGISGQEDPNNKEQAYNYLRGFNQNGIVVNPCSWLWGTVYGPPGTCNTINGRYMYSGDPVTLQGWVNNTPTDQRQMSNTGPFILDANKPVDIIAAYVVGRSTSALKSITLAKKIDRAAKFVFNNNFNFPPAPPIVAPVIKTEDNSIELIWETAPQVNYKAVGRGYDMVFDNYQVFMHNVNSVSEFESGRRNTVLFAKYDVANDITNMIFEDPVTLTRELIYEQGTQLDSSVYGNPKTGRISLKITTDPFTNGPLVKGKPYFFSIVNTAYNMEEVVKLDATGNYMIPLTAAVGSIANVPTILSDGISPVGIVPGKDILTPFRSGVKAEHPQGVSESIVTYEVKDRNSVSADPIEIGFRKDASSIPYNLFYYLKNTNTGSILFDSLSTFGSGSVNNLINGLVVNVEWTKPRIKSYEYSGTGESWFTLDTVKNVLGPFYIGQDVTDSLGVPGAISGRKSKITTADQLKKVEIRFGENSNAYRYVRKPIRFVFAGDSGIVSVPFQAWYVDKEKNIEQRLAVGFTETAAISDSFGTPDGLYNPGKDITKTKEYIIVFNTPYDPDCNNVIYKGNTTRWADLGNGYVIPTTIPNVTDSMKTIASSAFFDALYVVGLQRRSEATAFNPTGKYIIDISKPLTTLDKYVISNVQTNLNIDEKRALFEKVNVFPNPLFAYNPGVGYTGGSPDAPYITFSNLPDAVSIKIYTVSGNLVRTLEKNDNSPFMTWNLQNEDRLRVASGMYLAIVSNPELGDKVLKFAIILPQKQIQKY